MRTSAHSSRRAAKWFRAAADPKNRADIAGCGWCADRQDRGDQWNVANQGIRQRSAGSDRRLLQTTAGPTRTAATISALRRITQRVVPGAGRSASVSGLPSGPMTYFIFRLLARSYCLRLAKRTHCNVPSFKTSFFAHEAIDLPAAPGGLGPRNRDHPLPIAGRGSRADFD